MLLVNKDGRRHRYAVNLDAPFLHPSLEGYTLQAVLGQFIAPVRDMAATSEQLGSTREAKRHAC